METKSILPVSSLSNGPAAEPEQLLAAVGDLVRNLLVERDQLRKKIRLMEADQDCLRKELGDLRTERQSLLPAVHAWAKQQVTKEELESIVQENKWVEFDLVLQAAQAHEIP